MWRGVNSFELDVASTEVVLHILQVLQGSILHFLDITDLKSALSHALYIGTWDFPDILLQAENQRWTYWHIYKNHNTKSWSCFPFLRYVSVSLRWKSWDKFHKIPLKSEIEEAKISPLNTTRGDLNRRKYKYYFAVYKRIRIARTVSASMTIFHSFRHDFYSYDMLLLNELPAC